MECGLAVESRKASSNLLAFDLKWLTVAKIRIEYFGLVEPVGEAPYFGRNDKVVQHSFFGFMCMRGSSSSSRFR